MRDASDRSGSGNRVSSVFVELTVAEPQPAVRLRRIHEATSHPGASHAATGPTALLDLSELAPPVVVRAAARPDRALDAAVRDHDHPTSPARGSRSTRSVRRCARCIRSCPSRPSTPSASPSSPTTNWSRSASTPDARSMHDLDVRFQHIERGIDELRPSGQTSSLRRRAPRPLTRRRGRRPQTTGDVHQPSLGHHVLRSIGSARGRAHEPGACMTAPASHLPASSTHERPTHHRLTRSRRRRRSVSINPEAKDPLLSRAKGQIQTNSSPTSMKQERSNLIWTRPLACRNHAQGPVPLEHGPPR